MTDQLLGGSNRVLEPVDAAETHHLRDYETTRRDFRWEDIHSEFDWAKTGKVNMATILKYSAHGELDPYRTSGLASQALLKELIAGASIVGRTSERHRF